MHIDGDSRLATGVAALILLTAFSHPLWSQAADESGTLVMVARTANAVIVSVDSKVTAHTSNLPPPESPATPIDGDRKLVNVGEHSSCAINGFLGKNEAGSDVSTLMRLWIAAHPKTEAQEAIDVLLDAAAGSWNDQGFTLDDILVQIEPRKFGNPITTITSGEFVDGHPIVVVGATHVKAGGPTGQQAGKQIFLQEEKTVLYMSGVYSAQDFTELMKPQRFRSISSDPKIDNWIRGVYEDIRKNNTAMAVLRKWYNDSSALTLADVKDLFVPTFAPVELHFSDRTATPNNVRILTSCGRLSPTTVEGDWPTCPPTSITVTKKKQKSFSEVKGSKPSPT